MKPGGTDKIIIELQGAANLIDTMRCARYHSQITGAIEKSCGIRQRDFAHELYVSKNGSK